MIGIVKGREIKKNRDGDQNVLVLQLEIADPDDLQSVELITQMGEDYNPPNGSRVVVFDIGDAFKVGIACADAIVPSAAVGVRRIYSIASGAISALTEWLTDGKIKHNSGNGTAVEFARLKTEFNQLQSDFDTHIHGAGLLLDSTSGACTGTTAIPTATSTADIDNAESDTVLLP
jgi:hypothetical protein